MSQSSNPSNDPSSETTTHDVRHFLAGYQPLDLTNGVVERHVDLRPLLSVCVFECSVASGVQEEWFGFSVLSTDRFTGRSGIVDVSKSMFESLELAERAGEVRAGELLADSLSAHECSRDCFRVSELGFGVRLAKVLPAGVCVADGVAVTCLHSVARRGVCVDCLHWMRFGCEPDYGRQDVSPRKGDAGGWCVHGVTG